MFKTYEEIEIKYLGNFTPPERVSFYRQQRARKKAAYDNAVLASSDSITVLQNDELKRNSALEIRYVLNRIAANDPRDTEFELGKADSISNADKLALDIAKAFQTNTACRRVVLKGIGLTDQGLLPILSVLQRKRLLLLDVADNKFSEASFRVIENAVSHPSTAWQQVDLGRIKVSPELATVLSKHSNIAFQPLVSLSIKERL